LSSYLDFDLDLTYGRDGFCRNHFKFGDGIFILYGVNRGRKCIGNGKRRNMESLKVDINFHSVYLVHEVDPRDEALPTENK
jgi:hypothetical protein